VTRFHKLIVAAALLAGGYGLALVVSGLSDFLWARQLIRGTGDTSFGGDASFGGSWIGGPTATGTTRLVPEPAAATAQVNTEQSGAVPRDGVPLVSGAAQPSPSPTWLAPVLQANWVGDTQDKHDELTSTATNVPATNVAADKPAPEAEASGLAGQPRARLTDVKRSRNSASAGAADVHVRSTSPWDRWPRWDPPAAVAAPAEPDNRAPASVPAEMVSVGSSTARRDLSSSFDGPSDDSAANVAELRTHIVVDGDSLPKLADRYLDEPQLGDAIFQLNRDVLSDPELLPIGTVLKIPERRMASSSRAGRPSPDPGRRAVRVNGSILQDADAWEPVDVAPRAQLLTPQSPTTAPAIPSPATSSW